MSGGTRAVSCARKPRGDPPRAGHGPSADHRPAGRSHETGSSGRATGEHEPLGEHQSKLPSADGYAGRVSTGGASRNASQAPRDLNPDTGLSPIQLAEVIEQPTMGNNSEMIGVFKKHCSKLELTPDEYIQGHSQLLINQERIIASLQTQLNSAYAQLYPPSHRGIREESKEASSQSSNQSQPAAYLSTQARPSATENDCGIM